MNLLGVDVWGWLTHLWDQLKDVPIGYLIAGVLLQVAQTTFNGVAYYGILRYAYPEAGVALWPIVTAYAVGVGMNSFLPANIGTFVTLLMFVAIIPGSSFAGIFAAYLVNKIFFSVVGALVYVLMFFQAGAAFNVELGWFRDHALLTLLDRRRWCVPDLRAWTGVLAQAEGPLGEGRAGRQDPGRSEGVRHAGALVAGSQLRREGRRDRGLPGRVFDPGHVRLGRARDRLELGRERDLGDPGAVGVTQAANSVALRDYTDGATATAYSLSQQLVTSATNVLYALVLVLLIFGWTGGKALVATSYSGAKEKVHRPKHDEPEATGAGG